MKSLFRLTPLLLLTSCAKNPQTQKTEWMGPAVVLSAGYKGVMIGIKLYGRNDPEPAAPVELPTEILTIPLSTK